MAKHPKRPRDPNQLAKLVIDIAAGDAKDAPQPSDKAPMSAAEDAGYGGTSRKPALGSRGHCCAG